MADDGVEFNNSKDDGGVDLDESMDDYGVDLYRSIDADFIKVTAARKFTFDDLVTATNNFSEREQLGKGGFGTVYRGFLKELDCYVAVKRVSRDSNQGIKEYASEVKIISQLRHRNIVQLMGWCHERKELLLVYEFMPNSSLDSHLFKGDSLLPWEVRYKIVEGLASGLLYLHQEWEHYVVHRDIKPSNIMLDSDFNAKIGDFGLARLGDHGKDLEYTPLAGTVGYVAPEYAALGRASRESDVYSFGTVSLEIACGRKVIDRKASREVQINLREWIWDLYGEGKLLEAADPRLNGEFDKQQMECLMIVGLWCAHPDVKLRPTIGNAINVLNFVAPLPDLPPKMPMVTYFAPFSMSSSGSDWVGSKEQSPSVGYSDLVLAEQKKLAVGGFGALYKGFPRELNFGLWGRNTGKKLYTDFGKRSGPLIVFPYEDLVRATDNFSKENEFRDAGFDRVYRGFLKQFNFFVEIKKAPKGYDQDMREYVAVNIIGRLKHKNIVPLIGLCKTKNELFLVYEFMSNGSLDSHLFHKDRVLKWKMRYKIAQALASALLYLHEESEPCVVHRDIKSNNVMLDSDFNAKLGLPMLMDHGGGTTTNSAGNMGYKDPDYLVTGKARREYDVYSFGIVALEIACGRKPINRRPSEDQYIVQWVGEMYRKGKLLEAVDPRLNGMYNRQQVECLMIVGLSCTLPDAKLRPTIKKAIQVLDFVAPLTDLQLQMPDGTYFVPLSMFSNDAEPSKLAEVDFDAVYERILRELNSSSYNLWERSNGKKKYFEMALGSRMFLYKDLVRATNNFSEQMKVKDTGFCTVYRGFLSELHSYVAVKRVLKGSNEAVKKHVSEVIINSRLRHRNIVKLIGWCHERKELLLVYEFMPNDSLDSHLFQEDSFLTWEVRYKIAKGLASGMLYLHKEWERCVVHRNIRLSNVMMDGDFNAKLRGFRLAKLVDHDDECETTMVAGTLGYIDPEYVVTGKVGKESDVYSFGIVVLEIASGRRTRMSYDDEFFNIAEWVWYLNRNGKLLKAADPRLNGSFDEQQMERLLVTGLRCAHPKAKFRPSIEQALRDLNFEAPWPSLSPELPPFGSISDDDMGGSQGPFSGDITESSMEIGR